MCALAVGIDLGTTNSCVAVYKNGKVEIIQNDEQSYIVPSWVSFTQNGIITGHQAKDEAYRNISNTIYEVKRLMGQRFNDPKVRADIKRFPYKVFNDGILAKIKVTYQNKEEQYLPEEISAFILRKLKDLAETRLGQNITHVVVTIPAYFNDFQRKVTKDAATIAGFQQVNVINEPTAAALAFSYQNQKNYKRNVMVYDFGGGTFDVSIVAVGRGVCEVKATKGDSHLGGADLNANMVNFIRKDFKRRFGREIDDDESTMRRVKARCEKVKEELSGKRFVELRLDNLSGKDYFKNISRMEFEQLNMELFQRTLHIVKECLKGSGLTKEEIDEIVMVGGSSRIPKVQKMIEDFFGEDKINKGVNPDEAVAYGAAIYASGLLEEKCEIKDVLSLSLGITVVNPKNKNEYLSNKIIHCNTPIPAKITKRYVTSHDNQVAVAIVVHQGEGELAEDNFELGNFIFSGLTKAPMGVTKLDVCFEIDFEGILKVTASELDTFNVKGIEINVKKKGLTSQQVAQRTQEMENHRQEEIKRNRFAAEKYDAEMLCERIAQKAKKIEDKDMRTLILNKCNSISLRLENMSLSSQDELTHTKEELEDYNAIM